MSQDKICDRNPGYEGLLICKAAHPPDPSFVDNKPVSYTPRLSVFYLPLAPLAGAFIVVEGFTVLVH